MTLCVAMLFLNIALAENAIELDDGTILKGNIGAINSSKTAFYFVFSDPKMKPRWVSIAEIRKISFSPSLIRDNKIKDPEAAK